MEVHLRLGKVVEPAGVVEIEVGEHDVAGPHLRSDIRRPPIGQRVPQLR